MSALASVSYSLQNWNHSQRRFRNRRHAGRELAERLLALADDDPVVLGIRVTGFPVAVEVAQALEAPLDMIVACKIRVRDQPPVTIGAAAEAGVAVLDEEHVRTLRVGADELDEALVRAHAEVRRDVALYRGGRPLVAMADRTAVLIDDGLTSGSTARAAVRAARALGADRVVLATPVARAEVARALAAEADQIVCLRRPKVLWGVGFWYDNYDPVPEAAVVEALSAQRRR